MLVVARKRGLIENVPDVEWLERDQPGFDFLDFNEAKRLLASTPGEWRTMILTALQASRARDPAASRHTLASGRAFGRFGQSD